MAALIFCKKCGSERVGLNGGLARCRDCGNAVELKGFALGRVFEGVNLSDTVIDEARREAITKAQVVVEAEDYRVIG